MGGRGSAGRSGGGGSGGVEHWSLARVGRLASGNEWGDHPGMTVAQEYRMKEIEGKYSENDYARAAAHGLPPREYQAEITASIAAKGILSPARVDQWTDTRNGLSEGYHRYAAARKLGLKTMPVISTGN